VIDIKNESIILIVSPKYLEKISLIITFEKLINRLPKYKTNKSKKRDFLFKKIVNFSLFSKQYICNRYFVILQLKRLNYYNYRCQNEKICKNCILFLIGNL